MGELIVSGGGSTAVATAELFEEAARLGAVEAMLGRWHANFVELNGRLETLAGTVSEPMRAAPASEGLGRATGDLAWGRVAVERASDLASELRSALVEAGERYGATEASIDRYAALGGQVGAWALGLSLRMLPLVTIQAIAAGGIAAMLARGGDLDDLLSDPGFVSFAASAVDSVDEFVAGAFLVPPALAVGAGAEIRAPEAASVLLGVAGLFGVALGSRALVEGPVRVTRVPPGGRADQHAAVRSTFGSGAPPVERTVTAPTGYADLADRIPASDAGAQIRVERYGGQNDPRWLVYIGGTVDFTMTAGTETNDMTSNVHGIADDSSLDALRITGGDSAAVERAVRLALAEAGAEPGDPLLPVGHSGGGIVAAALAGDPDLNVTTAVNLGGPVISEALRDGATLLTIEHEEDLVPATGGWGHPSPDRLTVSRSVLEAGVEYDEAVPAHLLVRYQETAALMDASDEPRLVAMREEVAAFTGGGTGEMTRWVATRELGPSELSPSELSPSTPDAARGR